MTLTPEEHGRRVAAGLRKAKAIGVRLGRPRSDREPEIERRLLGGERAAHIRKDMQIGVETVQRVKRRLVEAGLLKPGPRRKTD